MQKQISRNEILSIIAKKPNIFVMDRPVIAHKISGLRNRDAGMKECCELVEEIAQVMLYEATLDVPTEEVHVVTPVGETMAPQLSGKKPVLVQILRAGQIMVTGARKFMPTAKIGTIGLYRDPATYKPVQYYCKLPKTSVEERQYYVMDPMLATGGSAIEAVNMVKKDGGKDIAFLCVFATPEGLRRLMQAHPDIRIFIGVVDEYLTDDNYIYPGMGDAGDRLFGTQ